MSFKNIRLMPTPEEIKKMEPISPELKAIKDENDKQLKDIFTGKDNRFVVIGLPVYTRGTINILSATCFFTSFNLLM